MREIIETRITHDLFNAHLVEKGFIQRKVNDAVGYAAIQYIDKFKRYDFGVICVNRYGKFQVNNLGAGISFLPLESIVSPILVSNGLMGDSILEELPATISFSTANDFLVADKDALTTFASERLPIVIENETDIDIFIQAHIDFYFQFIEPFFNRWCDIRDLLPLIENMETSKAFDFFGTGAVFKLLTIWKLCNHPKVSFEIERWENNFLQMRKNDPTEIQYERYYNASNQLSEVLSKTEPLYEWDPEYLKLK